MGDTQNSTFIRNDEQCSVVVRSPLEVIDIALQTQGLTSELELDLLERKLRLLNRQKDAHLHSLNLGCHADSSAPATPPQHTNAKPAAGCDEEDGQGDDQGEEEASDKEAKEDLRPGRYIPPDDEQLAEQFQKMLNKVEPMSDEDVFEMFANHHCHHSGFSRFDGCDDLYLGNPMLEQGPMLASSSQFLGDAIAAAASPRIHRFDAAPSLGPLWSANFVAHSPSPRLGSHYESGPSTAPSTSPASRERAPMSPLDRQHSPAPRPTVHVPYHKTRLASPNILSPPARTTGSMKPHSPNVSPSPRHAIVQRSSSSDERSKDALIESLQRQLQELLQRNRELERENKQLLKAASSFQRMMERSSSAPTRAMKRPSSVDPCPPQNSSPLPAPLPPVKTSGAAGLPHGPSFRRFSLPTQTSPERPKER